MVIFIHGDNQNHTAGKHILSFFKNNQYPLLYFDRPGMGASEEYRSGSYSFNREQGTLHRLFSSCNDKGIILIGHSSGGMFALQYTLEHQENIRCLILIEASHKEPALYIEHAGDIQKHYLLLSQQIFEEKKIIDYSEINECSDKPISMLGLRTTSPSVVRSRLEALNGFDASHRLKELKVPVLIIRGSESPLISTSIVKEFNLNVKKSLQATLEGGHHCHLQNKLGLQRILENSRSFLSSA